MELTETTIDSVKLEKVRAYAREHMRAKRAADPDGMREYMRAWRAANRDKIKSARNNVGQKKYKNENDYDKRRLASAQRWRTKNPDKLRGIKRAWYKNNTEKVKLQVKRTAFKRIYGLTLEQHSELFEKQGRKCAICKSTEPGTSKNWHTDHCHATKQVRGILCNHCNLMLGYAKDNEATLANAIEYLRTNGMPR